MLGYANTAHLAGDDLEAARAAGRGIFEMQDRNMALGLEYAEFVAELIARIVEQLGEEQFDAASIAGRQMNMQDFGANAESAARSLRDVS